MTITVELDHWATSHVGSAFVVQLQTVPLKGEEMRLHKNLFPETYKHGYDHLTFDEDGFADVTVCGIWHQVSKEGHTIQVGFEIDL